MYGQSQPLFESVRPEQQSPTIYVQDVHRNSYTFRPHATGQFVFTSGNTLHLPWNVKIVSFKHSANNEIDVTIQFLERAEFRVLVPAAGGPPAAAGGGAVAAAAGGVAGGVAVPAVAAAVGGPAPVHPQLEATIVKAKVLPKPTNDLYRNGQPFSFMECKMIVNPDTNVRLTGTLCATVPDTPHHVLIMSVGQAPAKALFNTTPTSCTPCPPHPITCSTKYGIKEYHDNPLSRKEFTFATASRLAIQPPNQVMYKITQSSSAPSDRSKTLFDIATPLDIPLVLNNVTIEAVEVDKDTNTLYLTVTHHGPTIEVVTF